MDILAIVWMRRREVTALHELLRHHQSGHYRAMQPFVTDRPRPTDHLLIWVLSGGLDGTIGNDPVHATTGDMLIFDPGVPQRYGPSQSREWEWLWVHFGGGAAIDMTRRIRGPSPHVVEFGLDEHIRTRFVELVASSAVAIGDRPDLRVDSCLYSLLGLIVDRVDRLAAGVRFPTQRYLYGIHEFVNERLAEPLILDDLVKHTGLSPSHLARLFREQIGTSPMQYVARQRMARAATLLKASTLTVAEIARSVGYPDPYHFSRRFKHATGYAPVHYRNASQRSGD